MNIRDWLRTSVEYLKRADVGTARLDCLVLLEDTLGTERAYILAHPDRELAPAELDSLHQKIIQRAEHAPLAYIRGKTMFYGRTFAINSSVLVPRPETETMIELLIKLSLPTAPKLADIGAGSGCIGITAALEVPNSEVSLYDIDTAALAITTQNASALKAKNTHIAYANLAEPCTKKQFDAVLANLPYVPDTYPINRAATFEPSIALFSGTDGLDAYRMFWRQLGGSPYKPSFILTESLPFQHHTIAKLARNAGFVLEQTQDFIQVFTRMD